jgi:hypothetical protein
VAQLTYFFDRCIGKRLPDSIRRADPPFQVEYFDDPKATVKLKQDTPDDVWLPLIAKRGWVIVSHDAKWHKNEVERAAVKQHSAACVYLYGNNSLTWHKLRVFMRVSERLNKLVVATPRPFILRVTGNGHITPVKI